MPSMKKSQRGGLGPSCGANKGDKPMLTGGAKSKKSKKSMKSSKKSSGAKWGPNEGRCFHCKMDVMMVNPVDSTLKTKTRVMKFRKGKCPKCGGKVTKIVGGG